MFENEQKMVDSFITYLEEDVSNPWGEVKIGIEFYYLRGRTDLVAVSKDGKVIAFEAKLNKWRIALQQAYRNRCFADISYVVLPEKQALFALRSVEEFKKRGVGLCFISETKNVEIIHIAENAEPLQLSLRQKALTFACNEGLENDERIRGSCSSNM